MINAYKKLLCKYNTFCLLSKKNIGKTGLNIIWCKSRPTTNHKPRSDRKSHDGIFVTLATMDKLIIITKEHLSPLQIYEFFYKIKTG